MSSPPQDLSCCPVDKKQFKSWAGHLSIPYPPSRTTQLTLWGLTMTSSPTTSSNPPLLTFSTKSGTTTITVKMSLALRKMLQALKLNYKHYFLHNLRRGRATAAYRQGTQHMAIKRHGLWASDTFGEYKKASCVQHSPVAPALVGCITTTMGLHMAGVDVTAHHHFNNPSPTTHTLAA